MPHTTVTAAHGDEVSKYCVHLCECLGKHSQLPQYLVAVLSMHPRDHHTTLAPSFLEEWIQMLLLESIWNWHFLMGVVQQWWSQPQWEGWQSRGLTEVEEVAEQHLSIDLHRVTYINTFYVNIDRFSSECDTMNLHSRCHHKVLNSSSAPYHGLQGIDKFLLRTKEVWINHS